MSSAKKPIKKTARQEEDEEFFKDAVNAIDIVHEKTTTTPRAIRALHALKEHCENYIELNEESLKAPPRNR